jgi:hypothetical protein
MEPRILETGASDKKNVWLAVSAYMHPTCKRARTACKAGVGPDLLAPLLSASPGPYSSSL